MRGVVLAGGLGTRLRPLTSVMNKHLLPVFNQPMLFYPLQSLAEAGITEAVIVVGGQSTEAILKLCKDGRDFGFKRLYYVYQDGEGGIAAALALTEEFVNGDSVCVILGDNIILGESLAAYRDAYVDGRALVVTTKVPDPENYGVPTFDDAKRILYITEKPERPSSNFGVIGLYFYDKTVYDRIRRCVPSGRGELEITDVNNSYAEDGLLSCKELKGTWLDAGSSIQAWIKAGQIVEKQRMKEHDVELLTT